MKRLAQLAIVFMGFIVSASTQAQTKGPLTLAIESCISQELNQSGFNPNVSFMNDRIGLQVMCSNATAQKLMDAATTKFKFVDAPYSEDGNSTTIRRTFDKPNQTFFCLYEPTAKNTNLPICFMHLNLGSKLN